jgi:hypothetical protein
MQGTQTISKDMRFYGGLDTHMNGLSVQVATLPALRDPVGSAGGGRPEAERGGEQEQREERGRGGEEGHATPASQAAFR